MKPGWIIKVANEGKAESVPSEPPSNLHAPFLGQRIHLCIPQVAAGKRRLGGHQMGNNSGDYLLYLLEVVDESSAIT